VDSVSDSKQPSVDYGQLSTTSADIHANGSVPRALGTDNEAFDAGARDTAAENQPGPGQTMEKIRAEMTVDEAGRVSSVSAEQDGVRLPLSKKVSFVGSSEEPTRNKENSTQLN